MPELDSTKRKELPDNAFAYIDSRGRRRLPINDAAHVRNALSRFNQVIFEDEEARDRARSRLLKAAARYGIVPVGFVEGQLRASGQTRLPTGAVTFLMLDIVNSTGLLHRLEDRYGQLLTELRRLIRTTVRKSDGLEVDARGDEYFAVFKRAADALTAATQIQAGVAAHEWPDGVRVRLRFGIHSGRPTLTESGYVGLAVHAVRRICSAAGPDQVVVSQAAVSSVGTGRGSATVGFVELGPHRLKGLPEAELLYRVSAR
jgi:class 3 adenylate cyclase